MFAKRLKQLRLDLNMKQSELANKIDVSPSTIGMYEQGRRTADQDTLIKLAEAFNVTIDYLLGRSDEPNTTSKNRKSDSEDEEKDIEKAIDELLQQDGLMLCGDELDDEALLLLRDSIRTTIKLMRANKK
jgi:transcriptional regulator with XRE-family HTH domain